MNNKTNNKRRRRLIFIALSAVIVVFLITLTIARWDVWFGNPTEPAFTAAQEPTRVQLSFGKQGEFSRSVSWQCGSAIERATLQYTALSSAELIEVEAEAHLFKSEGGTTIVYSAEIDSLKPGEVYGYRVAVGNRFSKPYLFTVPDDTDSLSRFVYFGDVQDEVGSRAGDFFRAVHQSVDADFWLFGGDLIERPHDAYWQEYFRSVDSIAESLPILAVTGNHDYHKGVSNRLDERFQAVFPILQQEEQAYATFEVQYGNVALIGLDSNRDLWQLFAQRKWFEQALERAKASPFKVVVMHHPPISLQGWSQNMLIRRFFLPLIEDYKVDLVLSGHEHAYARKISKKKDSPTTPVFIISNSSAKDYRFERSDRFNRFGNGQRFFLVVEQRADSLTVSTYNAAMKLYDRVAIIDQKGTKTVVDESGDLPEEISWK